MRSRTLGILTIGLLTLLGLTGPSARAASEVEASRVAVRVDGLTCPFCGYGIEKRIKRLEAVASYRVNVSKGAVELIAKPGRAIAPELVRQAIANAGFTPRAITLTATGMLGSVNGRPTFTLLGVVPPVRYPVRREPNAAAVDEAEKSGDKVRVTGRLEATGDESAPYELVVDQTEALRG